MNRRDLLMAATVKTFLSVSANGARKRQEERRFAKVKVSRERVIRTVVGLRPFRPSGFVVKTEKLDEKTVIHNYGHGGGGITLSWGTAQLAVEEALRSGQTKYAVLGCG